MSVTVHSVATTGAASDAGSLLFLITQVLGDPCENYGFDGRGQPIGGGRWDGGVQMAGDNFGFTFQKVCGSASFFPGKRGMENNAHHAPEPPIANRNVFVDPPAHCIGSTVTSSSKMPAAYPRAIPSEEMRAVARESFSESA